MWAVFNSTRGGDPSQQGLTTCMSSLASKQGVSFEVAQQRDDGDRGATSALPRTVLEHGVLP